MRIAKEREREESYNNWELPYITSLNVMLFIFRHSFICHISCCLLLSAWLHIQSKHKRFQMVSKHRQIFRSCVLDGTFLPCFHWAFAAQTNLRSIKINIMKTKHDEAFALTFFNQYNIFSVFFCHLFDLGICTYTQQSIDDRR